MIPSMARNDYNIVFLKCSFPEMFYVMKQVVYGQYTTIDCTTAMVFFDAIQHGCSAEIESIFFWLFIVLPFGLKTDDIVLGGLFHGVCVVFMLFLLSVLVFSAVFVWHLVYVGSVWLVVEQMLPC